MYFYIFVFVAVVALGTFLAYSMPRLGAEKMSLLILFAAAYIFSTTVVHLFPEMFSVPVAGLYIGLIVLGGFLLQHFLAQLTLGIEHGHLHKLNKETTPHKLLLALCLHAFLEGFVCLHSSSLHNVLAVNSMLLGVLMHKLPASIALALLLRDYYKPDQQRWAFAGIGVFALSTPLALLMSYILSKSVPQLSWMGLVMLPLLGGMFLHLTMAMFFRGRTKAYLRIS